MRRWLIGLVVVDLPVLLAVLAVGSVYGYAHTYEAVTAWRMQHPWSLLPSLVALALIVRRWRSA